MADDGCCSGDPAGDGVGASPAHPEPRPVQLVPTAAANGTAIDMAGWIWGVALAVAVHPHSRPGMLLLISYLLWSPVGTLVT